MGFYRKLPVVIEARQTGQDYDEDCAIMEWCGGSLTDEGNRLFYIHTLEGDMAVSSGDWVIKGVADEFYPCDPEVFAATYEEVGDDETWMFA